jgi:hypothetical protein
MNEVEKIWNFLNFIDNNGFRLRRKIFNAVFKNIRAVFVVSFEIAVGQINQQMGSVRQSLSEE